MNSRPLLVCLAVLAGFATEVRAQSDSVSPGGLSAYSTIYSIGLEWDVVGDWDHDATATIDYRAAGTAEWRPAGSLIRVDFNGRNMLAGSILFLNPGTEYEVFLSLSDPDGGGDTRSVAVITRPLPKPPQGGRVFFVQPGAGGGDGSAQAPFLGVEAAQAIAQPGDTFLLHAGSYGGRIRFTRPGALSNYIVWKALGDGDVWMDGLEISASHIWLEGISVANQTYGTVTDLNPIEVVITRCRFLYNYYNIFVSAGGTGWYIADNTIIGINPVESGSDDGEGIDLRVSDGHTIAHNSITNVADGISYPGRNVDIFGNDIFDTSDDGIELDAGLANVRVWGNRIHNALHNGISFQPQDSAPWYIVRNQIVGSVEAPLKFRTTDRFVLLHNTIVNWEAWPGTTMICCSAPHLLRAYARNNLWIAVQSTQMWGFGPAVRDWRSDLDYDGFDWGDWPYAFTYGSVIYADVWSFAAASGLETHGIQVAKEQCFEDFQVWGPSPTPVPPHAMTLRSGCNAIDAGAVLPGINDGYAGAAPDIGAHEYGHPAPAYGPRPYVDAPPPDTGPGAPPPPPSDDTPTGVWEIVARHSGLCLDVSGASAEDGAPLIQWSCHGGSNQQWILVPAGNDYYSVVSRHSGKALDVSAASFDGGAGVIQYPLHGGENQHWRFEPVGDGYYRLTARHSQQALDVSGASARGGAAVIQWYPHDGANQQWLLRPAP